MRMPPNLKPYVLKEFDFVVAKLKEPLPLEERVYYYSALYGAVYRVMNIDCTPNLIFLHHILNAVHSVLAARLQAMSRAGERPIVIDEKMIARLTELTETLAGRKFAQIPTLRIPA